MTVPVKVRNDSSQPWPPERKIRLSYHVKDAAGGILQWDGPKTCLPRTLRPGEEAVVNCLIAPLGPHGDCHLEFDLFQEGVAWFHEKGSPVCNVPCRVAAS